MQKIKSWFTLVEMLIVVVIIGILSAALLPRLTGHMARTRDLKRQTDLRNIATAIQQYQIHHQLTLKKDPPTSHQLAKFPWLMNTNPQKVHQPNIETYRDLAAFGSVKYLRTVLAPYLSEIPRDPLPKSHVRWWHKGCWDYMQQNNSSDCPETHSEWRKAHWHIEDGEYFFIQLMTAYNTHGRTLLIAKVETPEAANRVGSWDLSASASWGNVDNGLYYAASNHFYFKNIAYNPKCATITKGTETRQAKTDRRGNIVNDDCIYISENQLYYILEVGH